MRAVRLAAAGVDFGIDQAGPDRGDADAFARDFVTKSDREGIDRALRGRIIDIGVGRTQLAATDDMLMMTPPLPPWRVDIRFTASRAHSMLPVTLTAIMR